ncbi:hypothetical protein E2C01_060502 [Portunus trituberculatus]|uniref:Uncharacterized protein n=1 Tax=Portunus trituberculatus TaxID=210409 RepID=A0A5B7H9M0_PORTR|nr:hypothetical protein [Portunus trituberculatus]
MVSLLLLYCVYLCVFASLVNLEPFEAVYYRPTGLSVVHPGPSLEGAGQ